jgi:hypothetical protein
MAYIPKELLTVTKGIDKLSVYQWNTRLAKHYFCSVCGIYTHHQLRTKPSHVGFNVGCLDDVNPLEMGEVSVVDGASRSLVTEKEESNS